MNKDGTKTEKLKILVSLVQFPLEPLFSAYLWLALVAQLDRVFGYEPKGRGFESLRAHHLSGSGSTW